MKHLFFLLFFLSVRFYSFAQANSSDTIYFMNGKIVAAKVIDTLLGGVTYREAMDTSKKETADNDDLFSVLYTNGNIHYYYYQDTANGNEFSREEMWYYMSGERDASKGFKARGSFWGGVVSGIAGGLTGNLLGPVVPFAFVGLCGIPKVRIRHETISNPYNIDHDPYILGYEREARGRRRLKAVIGGGIGLVMGYTTNFIIAKSNPNFKLVIKF